MADQQVERTTVRTATKPTMAGVVSQYIAPVMRAPTGMSAMEDAIKVWLNSHAEGTEDERKLMLEQLTRGRQVMESLHSLVFQAYPVNRG